jgi:hypothetical protein
MERVGPLIIIVVATLIVFWPTIYALIKRRWFRAFAYFGLTLPVIWITLNSHHWWGPVDPEYDFGPLKNPLAYYVLNWPVLTAILWTITAVSDALLATEKSKTRDDR